MAKPAGHYLHHVSVIAPVESQLARTGAIKQTPQVVKADQFARVTALSASEQLKSTGQVQVGLYRVEMRYRTDITNKNQLIWQETGIKLEITGVNPNPNEGEIEFMCTSIS